MAFGWERYHGLDEPAGCAISVSSLSASSTLFKFLQYKSKSSKKSFRLSDVLSNDCRLFLKVNALARAAISADTYCCFVIVGSLDTTVAVVVGTLIVVAVVIVVEFVAVVAVVAS